MYIIVIPSVERLEKETEERTESALALWKRVEKNPDCFFLVLGPKAKEVKKALIRKRVPEQNVLVRTGPRKPRHHALFTFATLVNKGIEAKEILVVSREEDLEETRIAFFEAFNGYSRVPLIRKRFAETRLAVLELASSTLEPSAV